MSEKKTKRYVNNERVILQTRFNETVKDKKGDTNFLDKLLGKKSNKEE